MKFAIQGLILSFLSVVTYRVRAQAVMSQSPSSVVLPEEDETVLTCRMNIAPDRFQWRHYPVTKDQAYTSRYHLLLADARHYEVSPHMYKSDNYSTSLTIKNNNISVAGDYQCLAHYGAAVFASKPGRISIQTLENIPDEESITVNVLQGNTVLWGCPEPESNPAASMEYYRGDAMIYPKYPILSSLILRNLRLQDSGTYSCKAYNTMTRVASRTHLHLNVDRYTRTKEQPRFIVLPKKNYSVLKGSSAFLECAAIGSPVPRVRWSKISGQLSGNTVEEEGGLYITQMTEDDAGTYLCEHFNSEGSLPFKIEVEYHQKPSVEGPLKRGNKTGKIQTEEGQDLDIECEQSGVPIPTLSWLLNGHSVKGDESVKIDGHSLMFRPVHKRHAGMLQCFASNIVSTDYGMTVIEVYPKQKSGFDSSTQSHKKNKNRHRTRKPIRMNNMIPPSKPNVTRLNDESVVVRWKASSDNGLPIKFFKVQYIDIGKGGWFTANPDIPPHIRSFEINSLLPERGYRFRIAAVYSNDDNKLSQRSDIFNLTRSDFYIRNPLPVPIITRTETINSSAIQVFWEYTSNPNVSIIGFYVNYISANSAGDYNKATVDGENVRSYIISHLEPDTAYEFKMQSFTWKSASDFSHRMRERTASIVIQTTTIEPVKKSEPTGSNLYIVVAVSVVGLVCLLTVVTLLILCRKWKKRKDQNADGTGKQAEDLNHHIEAHKSVRANGFVSSGNHITIRSNPLAEADNKNQNMIEMSCLASQNNNCSGQTSTADSQGIHHNNVTKIKNKRHKPKDIAPGENYV